jgi:hypothetical protein
MEPLQLDTFLDAFTDPVERLLLTGDATTVSEAEEAVLNASLDLVSELLRGPLTDFRCSGSPDCARSK